MQPLADIAVIIGGQALSLASPAELASIKPRRRMLLAECPCAITGIYLIGANSL